MEGKGQEGKILIKDALAQANDILGSMTFTPAQRENLAKVCAVMEIHDGCIRALVEAETRGAEEAQQEEPKDDEQWIGGEENADADTE